MDLTTIVTQIAASIVEFQSLAAVAAYGVGLWYIAKAVNRGIKASSQPGSGETSGAAILTALLVGAVLLNFTSTMGDLWETMTGERGAGFGMVSYSGASAAGVFAPAINAIFTIVSTFGWWYGFKGLTMFKKASEGHGSGGYEDYAWKGFIHAMGVAAMVNIGSTVDAFKETIGMTF